MKLYNVNKALLIICCILVMPARLISAQQRRAVTPRDCVNVRYITNDYYHPAITINPQSTRVAYLVRSANLSDNYNETSLYVKTLAVGIKEPGKLLVTASKLSQIHWLEDGTDIIALTPDHSGRVAIIKINVLTGVSEIVVSASEDITEYSIDSKADTIVFATKVMEPPDSQRLTKQDMESGYRIPFEIQAAPLYPKSKLFLVKRLGESKWTVPEEVRLHSPVTGQALTEIPYDGQTLFLSLSPDGSRLILTYDALGKFPAVWRTNPFIRKDPSIEAGDDSRITLTVVHNLANGETKLAAENPVAWSVPLWSTNSRSFVFVAASPVGSRWEQEDAGNNVSSITNASHLFWVDVETGHVEEINPRAASGSEHPLSWTADGQLIVQGGAGAIVTFSRENGEWQERSVTRLPIPDLYPYAEIASDGNYTIGDAQTLVTPPELFLFKRGDQVARILTDLNPEFHNVATPQVKEIHWTTSTNYEVSGVLLMPPDYKESVRYPLVIQTTPNGGGFVCDSGENHDPSYIPQPLADAGIMYLIRTNWKGEDAVHYPTGYPGRVGEAAFQMDMWDRAVDELDSRGLIDRNEVGIIGFSKTGWYTEFTLAHSKALYRAATAADNAEYGLNEYWMAHNFFGIRLGDSMYAGPPYGRSLENWVKYSVSFNVEKFRTPLLMEEMGRGLEDNRNAPPIYLEARYDVFTGLNVLHKPVEMYYYPNEVHQPEHPQARLSSLQRNLDWYRFWLQGYERPNPEDPDQYKRWEHLRDLQDAEDKAVGVPGASPSKPN